MTHYGNSKSKLNGINVDISSHQSTLLEGLSLLRNKSLLLDVTLSAQGENFKVSFLVYYGNQRWHIGISVCNKFFYLAKQKFLYIWICFQE